MRFLSNLVSSFVSDGDFVAICCAQFGWEQCIRAYLWPQCEGSAEQKVQPLSWGLSLFKDILKMQRLRRTFSADSGYESLAACIICGKRVKLPTRRRRRWIDRDGKRFYPNIMGDERFS